MSIHVHLFVEQKPCILGLVDQNPQKGCGHIEHLLKLEVKNCSNPTSQKIIKRHQLRNRYQRLLKLEEQYVIQDKELSHHHYEINLGLNGIEHRKAALSHIRKMALPNDSKEQ